MGVSIGTFAWAFLLYTFVQKTTQIPWPKDDSPPLIYTSDTANDLRYLIHSALKTANHHIYLASFGITDECVITSIEKAASLGIAVDVCFDKKQPNYLKEGQNIRFFAYEKKGSLMHQKIIAIDEELVLLGSTNLTRNAIDLHRNLIVCLKSKELFQAILSNDPLTTKSFQFYPLPKCGKRALDDLIQKIDTAKNQICLSLFSFTHEKLIDALIKASQKGLKIEVYIDRGSERTASKKSMQKLKDANIPVFKNQSASYLHYKCALIDDTFAFGSLNWSKSGFSKNEEYLIFLTRLTKKQNRILTHFFKTLHSTCTPI